MMKKYIFLAALGTVLGGMPAVHAQELKINPSGRILMDMGAFDAKSDDFGNGVAVPDLRAGVKASYGNWKAKVDLGYSYGKLSLKDVFIEKRFNKESLLRVGHFVHQFGLQSSTSSSMKVTMEEPASNEAFFNSRLVGAMFIYDKSAFFGTASFFAENESMKKSTNETGSQGYGAMSRLVYRPLRDEGKIFHVGISGAFEKPRYNSDEELNHKSFILSSRFPSRIAKVKAVQSTIPEAKMLYKFTPELCAAYGPVALETQYYYVNVKREHSLKAYKASGAYGIIRGLLKGGNYTYSNRDSGIATPGAGALECVLSYNYTDMSDHKSEILGGRLNDVAFTMNYYINKYMIWRVRASYTHVGDRGGYDNLSVKALQTRLQIIF